MKFAHLADCHLGGWRDQRLRDANSQAFIKAIDISIQEKVDFVIIAGDLFNTSFPPIDVMRVAVQQLKRLQDAHIPVYGIPGSHDFSPSGKTILDVLESAGLFVGVAKGEWVEGKLKLRFTRDENTGTLLTGIFGRRGGLDKYYFQDLERESLHVKGKKIFVFHCALQELKPKGLEEMDAMSVSYLPKDFDYYAGGHVHVVEDVSLEGYSHIVFPGPTFPNNFSELETLRGGTMMIVEEEQPRKILLQPHPIHSITIDCENKNIQEVEELLRLEAEKDVPQGAIITVRLEGTLREGKPSQINYRELFSLFTAYAILKNTAKLRSKEYEEVQVMEDSVGTIEETLIRQHVGQSSLFDKEREQLLISELVRVLGREKDEGMKKDDHEKIIIVEVDSLLGLLKE